MGKKLQLNILSPEATLFTGGVSMAVIPGSEGVLAVLPRHASLATETIAGTIQAYDGDTVIWSQEISPGFMEFYDNSCWVFVT